MNFSQIKDIVLPPDINIDKIMWGGIKWKKPASAIIDYANVIHGFDSHATYTPIGYGNNYVEFSVSGGEGYYEKINIPITGLAVGKWYCITYSEEASTVLPGKNLFLDTGECIYGTSVRPLPVYSSNNYKSLLIHTSGTATVQPNMNPFYCTTIIAEGKKDNSDYIPTINGQLVFYAEATTMYWVWDISKLSDKNAHYHKFSHKSINEIPIPENEYVDFMHSTMYGFDISFPSAPTSTAMYGYGTYKLKCIPNDYLEIRGLGRSNVYEKLNIPLVNLALGYNYTLEFTYERTPLTGLKLSGKDLIDNENLDLCYAVKSTQLTRTDNYSYKNTPGFITNLNPYFDANYDFVAENTVMYLVWSESRLEDFYNNFAYHKQVIKNATLTWYSELNYETNGAANTIMPTRNYNANPIVADDIPIKPGYVFAGWSSTSNGQIEFTPGETIMDSIYLGHTNTLYAIFTLNK